MSGPSKILFGLEGVRAAYEYGLGHLYGEQLYNKSPKGDGHPVIVFPGLCTTDSSTKYLRAFLNELGYNAYPWNMGRNLGPKGGLSQFIDSLCHRVECIFKECGNTEISLIGWSLGGIYTREIAKRMPDSIRQVITLGTPFKSGDQGTNVSKLYEILSKDTSHKDPAIIQQISTPPPVPFTSIYSKTDGIVHWRCSIEDESHIHENIEIINASHLGLGHNPAAILVVADRLVNTKQNWKKYTVV